MHSGELVNNKYFGYSPGPFTEATGNGAGGAGVTSIGGDLLQILSTKGIGVATIAGIGAALVLDLDSTQMIDFVSVAALSSSIGEAVLEYDNLDEKIDKKLKPTSYYDLSDFVGGAAVYAILGAIQGFEGEELLMRALIAGVASGTGRQLMAKLFFKKLSNPKK